LLTGTHRLRHTSACDAPRAGVAITTVAWQLGNSSPRTTAQIYAHVIEDAQLVNAAVRSPGGCYASVSSWARRR
jgi:integrase